MKKFLLLCIFIIGSTGMTTTASFLPSDFANYIIYYWTTKMNANKELSLNELSNYTFCPEFTKSQKTYQALYSLGFIKDFGPVLENREFTYPYTAHAKYFFQLASSTPKSLIQQSLFPYGNKIHAEKGNGTQFFCENKNNNFYQMGTLWLKGHIVLQNVQLQGMTYTDTPVTVPAQKIYFLISEFKDPNVEKLPYLETIEGKKAVFLGCFSTDENDRKRDGSSISKLGALSINTDTIQNFYAIQPIHYNLGVQDLFKSSAENPEKAITVNAQLTPNVIFNHGLDIPCENSRIQEIEIIDDGGLGR